MRREYELTEEELQSLHEACKPVPYLIIGGRPPRSPQEKANAAWRKLAIARGFVWDTVKPIDGACDRHFTAEEAP